MNLDFDKIWASDTSPDYPSDTQTKRGLSYLGTEPPTFDLHDAIFQRLDKKDQWLYDQVRLTCERFGQSVSESVAGASRDTMANAITNALLTQRKADEGGYGIIKMANADQTNAGQEYNFAVSPKHLAEYVSSHNTWENTKDKPQTATRWPEYSEVKNTPILGSAAYFDAQTNTSMWEQDANSNALVKERTLASAISWADGWFKGLGTASTRNIFFGAGKTIEDFKYDSSLLSDMDAICVLRDSLVSRINQKQDTSALGTAAYSDAQTNVNIDDQDWKSEALVKEKTIALFRDYFQGIISKYGSIVAQNVFHGKSKDSIWDYPYDSSLTPDMDAICSLRDAQNNLTNAVKDSLKGGAYTDIQTNPNIWSQEYGKNRLALEETIATLRDYLYGNFVGKVRIVDMGKGTMFPGAPYGENAGEVVTRLQINGQVNGSESNQISVGVVQYLIAGNWITVDRVRL